MNFDGEDTNAEAPKINQTQLSTVEKRKLL